jgi:hypothetical protein
MTTEMLTRLIRADTTLRGFSPTDLPMAAQLNTLDSLVWLERYFSKDELSEVANWAKSSGGFEAVVARFRYGGCCYYVCADGSLYFESSAVSEVWSDAREFAAERIIDGGPDGPFDLMDSGLLRYLGGYLAEAVEERGTR